MGGLLILSLIRAELTLATVLSSPLFWTPELKGLILLKFLIWSTLATVLSNILFPGIFWAILMLALWTVSPRFGVLSKSLIALGLFSFLMLALWTVFPRYVLLLFSISNVLQLCRFCAILILLLCTVSPSFVFVMFPLLLPKGLKSSLLISL